MGSDAESASGAGHVATALGIKKEDVTCHVTLLGGGFGRKSKPDQVAEAAVLSKQLGKPVKVVWSREDDIRFDFFHSVAAMYMKAAIGPNGMPTAWLQRTVFPPINSTFDASATYGDDEMGLGWNNLPFDIPNHRAENGPADYHVRIGWLRSVANIYHAFAIHSFADELAVRREQRLSAIPARPDRPGAHRRSRLQRRRRGGRQEISARHRTAAARGRDGRGKIRAGESARWAKAAAWASPLTAVS